MSYFDPAEDGVRPQASAFGLRLLKRLEQRQVSPEWLDDLPASDLEAGASRRDLRRLNAWMGHVPIVQEALRLPWTYYRPRRIAELGAGDGTFLLKLAQRLEPLSQGPEVVLVDRQQAVAGKTLSAFARLRWRARLECQDVFEWLQGPQTGGWDLVLVNLFLHHFTDEQLVLLLPEVAERTRVFVALEPCRSRWAFCWSQFVGLLGCNRITRHDAPLSVQAGFRGLELSRCWPEDARWLLQEKEAGPFSHLFVASLRTS